MLQLNNQDLPVLLLPATNRSCCAWQELHLLWAVGQ